MKENEKQTSMSCRAGYISRTYSWNSAYPSSGD